MIALYCHKSRHSLLRPRYSSPGRSPYSVWLCLRGVCRVRFGSLWPLLQRSKRPGCCFSQAEFESVGGPDGVIERRPERGLKLVSCKQSSRVREALMASSNGGRREAQDSSRPRFSQGEFESVGGPEASWNGGRREA